MDISHKTIPKKTILTSRTFGSEIKEYFKLSQAVASFTARACEKLRKQKSITWHITVFIQTNMFKESNQYRNSITISLDEPSSYTPTCIRAALKGLQKIYRNGFMYKRAGVILTGISDDAFTQLNLFTKTSNSKYKISYKKQHTLMEITDYLNAMFGRNTIEYAIASSKKPWWMHQMKRSRRFTTKWDEIPLVKS